MSTGQSWGVVVPFTSEELPYVKWHGLRALCGLLMDRHSACHVCPFCGVHDPNDEADLTQVIVQAICQQDMNTGAPVVALYFSKAMMPEPGEPESAPSRRVRRWSETLRPRRKEPTPEPPEIDVVSGWGGTVTFAEDVPSRKAVVALLDNGRYYAEYGPIANPTRGDHSTGALDRTAWTLAYYCDPEPTYAQWRYWDSHITEGQEVVPEFLCLRLRGEWWILDRDRQRRMVQQVAALTVADNPDHPIQGREPIPWA